MNRGRVIKIILLVISIIAIIGIVIGVVFYKSNPKNVAEGRRETYNLTINDMYCNIRDSKRIVKVKITIETNSRKDLEILKEKQFLIRDDINKTIRDKTEENLQGKDGQLKLQGEIITGLRKLFNKTSIANIYFDDLIIQ